MAGNAVIGALRVDLGLDTAAWEDGLQKMEGEMSKLAKSISVGLGAIAAGFTAGVTAAVYRLEQMEKSSRQVDQVLANTGNSANTSAKEIADWAGELERRTGRAAQEVMNVSANLASYGFGEEVFFRAIELADDMAAAWGGDLRQNLDGLARALENPEKGLAMLSARGITFTAEGKKMATQLAKTGKSAEAAGVLMDELEGQVRGAAQAGFAGLTKSMANAKLAMDSFFEAVASGAGVGSLFARGLDVIAAGFDLLTTHIETLTKVATVAGTTMAVAFGPQLIGQVRMLALAIETQLIRSINLLTAAVARNPLGALAVGITAAATALTVFRHDIHPIAGEVATLGDYMAAAWEGIVPAVAAAGSAIQNAGQSAFQRWWDAARNTASLIGEWTGLWRIGANEVADANSQAAEETVRKWGWGIDETIKELSFLGAAGVATKDAFVAAWSNFPDLMRDVAAKAMSAFLQVIEWALEKVTDGLNTLLSVVNAGRHLAGYEPLELFKAPDLSGWVKEGTGAAADVAQTFSDSFAATRSDIEAGLDGLLEGWRGKALDLAGTREDLNQTQQAVKAFGDSVDDALGGGAGGSNGKGKKRSKIDEELREIARLFDQTRTPMERYNATVARLSELYAQGKINQELFARGVANAKEEYERAMKAASKNTFSFATAWEEAGRVFSSAMSGLIDGSKKAADVIGDLLKRLGDMWLNQAFQALFGGGGKAGSGGGGLLGNLFGGFFKGIPGFANGGSFQVGGVGGIDSQLVAFRASPSETVSITKPGQEREGGVHVVRVITEASPYFDTRVQSVSDRVASTRVAQSQDVARRQFPAYEADRTRRTV